MDEEQAGEEKIIGLAETILVLFFVGIEEFAEVLILVITLGAGIMVVEVMNGAMASLIEMYMLLRGGKGVLRLIVQPICGVFDVLTGGIAPGKLIGTAVGIWVINHPNTMGKAINVVTKTSGSVLRSATNTVRGIAGEVGSAVTASEQEKKPEPSMVNERARMAIQNTPTKMAAAERMAERRAAASIRKVA